jgi:hypothetical protein
MIYTSQDRRSMRHALITATPLDEEGIPIPRPKPWHGDGNGGGSQAVRGVPAIWRQLADAIDEFEPESHDEMLAFMAGGINSFAALAKAYLAVYEHCRDVRKLSQASVGALEDTSDAVSECMTALAYARQKYLQAYDPAAEVADQHGLPTRAREFFAPGEN